jgi:hypothetical protein
MAGANLATIRSHQELNYILPLLKGTGTSDPDVYLGAKYSSGQPMDKWMDGTPIDSALFSNPRDMTCPQDVACCSIHLRVNQGQLYAFHGCDFQFINILCSKTISTGSPFPVLPSSSGNREQLMQNSGQSLVELVQNMALEMKAHQIQTQSFMRLLSEKIDSIEHEIRDQKQALVNLTHFLTNEMKASRSGIKFNP